jgi:peptidoglycan/LPS O-acetylase OafA/YrhL
VKNRRVVMTETIDHRLPEINKSRVRREVGLDYIRVVGLLLVLWQHSCSLLSQDQLTFLGSLNLGQLGVGFFLILSGYLASRTNRKPVEWTISRLRRLFPAYWLAIAASLLGAKMLEYKPVTWDLVIAQLAGVAWFTHGYQMVNGPTWFVSLLLLCYAIALFIRFLPASGTLSLIAAGTLSCLAFDGINSFLFTHVSTFLLGFWMGSTCSKRIRNWQFGLMVFGSAILTIAGSPWTPYSVIAILALGIGLHLKNVDRWSQRIADYSYFTYLVHGPILLATTLVFAPSWWALTSIGLPAVAIGTGLLAISVHLFDRGLSRLFNVLHTEFAVKPS